MPELGLIRFGRVPAYPTFWNRSFTGSHLPLRGSDLEESLIFPISFDVGPDGSLYILDLSVVVVVDANGEFITRIPAGGTVDYLCWSPIRVSAASNSSRKSFPRAH